MRPKNFSRKSPNSRAFTLLEILIVVVIILIVASILIPNLIDAMHKAKQKKTMAEIKIVGDSFFSWHIDQVGAASAGASKTRSYSVSDFEQIDAADMANLLEPRYLQKVPLEDAWGNELGYHISACCTIDDGENFGLQCPIGCTNILMIVSCGMDHVCDEGSYQAGAFDARDHHEDLVWLDGYFIRRPGSVLEASNDGDVDNDDDDQGEDG
jgi:general secretion pathway protein G